MRIARKLVVAVMLGIVGLWASAASAEAPPPDYARDGFYLAAGAMYVSDDYSDNPSSDLPPFLQANVSTTWGFDARAGYRFHRHFAWDAQFQYLNDLTSSAPSGAEISRIDGQAFSVNLKGNLLTGRFQPYLLGGIGFLRLDGTSVFTEFAGRVAGGLDTYITENIVFYAEAAYLIPNADLSDYKMIPVSFGLQYRFGSGGEE